MAITNKLVLLITKIFFDLLHW